MTQLDTEFQTMIVAEQIISMWDCEGQHEGLTEFEYYNETLIGMGYNETDRYEIISEIDLED